MEKLVKKLDQKGIKAFKDIEKNVGELRNKDVSKLTKANKQEIVTALDDLIAAFEKSKSKL